MRKTTKMMSRLNKKVYNYDSKQNKFRIQRNQDGVKKKCYNCSKYGHLSYDCPKPSKFNKKQEDDGNQHEHSKKDYEKKHNKKKKSFKRKEKIKAFLGEQITNGEISGDKIHLIKVIPSTKKVLYRKTHRANQIFSRYYFYSSNAYAFIVDLENQIKNTVLKQNCQK